MPLCYIRRLLSYDALVIAEDKTFGISTKALWNGVCVESVFVYVKNMMLAKWLFTCIKFDLRIHRPHFVWKIRVNDCA